MSKGGYVYFLTNKWHTTIYIGVTSNLVERVEQHQNKVVKGFTQKYQLDTLIYYEVFDSIVDAIDREKYLKGKTRKFKEQLVRTMNPEWRDLSRELD